jgi:hypothetical protein
MKFYVDFDDCLCETAKAFTVIADNLFGKTVPYESMSSFNLQESFHLKDDEYEEMMIEGHKPEMLISFEETPGASKTLNDFIDAGHDVKIITGRPSVAYEASRIWLDQHGLDRAELFCLNKYGRDSFIKNGEFNVELEDYYKMKFDFAIEDSPMAFKFFNHMPELKVMVFDRPWNKQASFPGSNYHRCMDWEMIREKVRSLN